MHYSSFDNLLLFLEMMFSFLIAFCLQESNLTTSIHSVPFGAGHSPHRLSLCVPGPGALRSGTSFWLRPNHPSPVCGPGGHRGAGASACIFFSIGSPDLGAPAAGRYGTRACAPSCSNCHSHMVWSRLGGRVCSYPKLVLSVLGARPAFLTSL